MKKLSYTYSVLKYVHDPAAGEMLNIGVLLCAPAQHYFAVRLEHRYERLSEAFAGFDGEHFKRSLRQLETAIVALQERPMDGLFPLFDPVHNVVELGELLWPDKDLSFRFGPMLAGITDNLEEALTSIFNRLVTSQYERETIERRSDQQVWAAYQNSLIKERINRVLQPKTFLTEGFELKFEHGFQNERWHILQPVSLDYAKVEGMRNRVMRLLGDATALQDHPELGTLYVLLGKPKQQAHQEGYTKAKKLLGKIPIEHRIVEEKQAEQFAKDLSSYMRQHGVLKDKNEE